MRPMILILSFFQVVTALQNEFGPHVFHRLLDPKGAVVLQWFYDYSVEEITFELQVRTTGWVGFGLSTKEDLEGTDMVIGGVFPNQTTYFSDRHVEAEWPPVIDKEQNYHLLSLTENGTMTIMKFSRKFRTCDIYDTSITNDTVRVSAAYGLDDTLQYDEDFRFVKSICLMEVVHNVVMPRTYSTYDLKLTDFHVPVEDTTYACTFIPMPAVHEKHHLFMYEQHVDSSLVHHILIYACPNNTQLTTDVGDCYGGDPTFSQCNQVIFGWAVGGSPFILPSDTGIPIGTSLDPYYVRIEVHFSNFEGLEDIVDNTGIKIYYTNELRKHDAGVVQYGVFTFPIHFIPPGAKSYKTYGLCHTDQFHEVNGNHVEDMHVISYLNHGHLTVRGVRALHFRNGTYLGPLGDDNGYDFRLQEIRHHKETLLLKVGDIVIVECTQNTEDRDSVTFGGPSTLNEMCLTFLFYYPRTNISKCWAFTDIVHVIDELGLEHTTDVMEAIGTLYETEWDDDLIQKAEKAAKEALQTVIIESRQGIVRNTTAYLPEIPETKLGPCDAITYNNMDQKKPDKTVLAETKRETHTNKPTTAEADQKKLGKTVPAEPKSDTHTSKSTTAEADKQNPDKKTDTSVPTEPGVSKSPNNPTIANTGPLKPYIKLPTKPHISGHQKALTTKAVQHLPDSVTTNPLSSSRHPQTTSSTKADHQIPVQEVNPNPAGAILSSEPHEDGEPVHESYTYEDQPVDSHVHNPACSHHSHEPYESMNDDEVEYEGPAWSKLDTWEPEPDAYDYHQE